VTTRRSIENRKLILSQNAHETQKALKEYNSRKLILQTLKTLKNIPAQKNDTIYRNRIQHGTIQNTEIYKIIKNNEQNMTQWRQKHPLIIRNQSVRGKQFDDMKAILKKEDSYDHNIKILQELATITVKPNEITASNTGIRILETGTTLVKDVVSQGLNAISGPIKIIIITASIVGGIILLLIAYKYIHKNEPEKIEINLETHTRIHPHIWKPHDAYYNNIISTN